MGKEKIRWAAGEWRVMGKEIGFFKKLLPIGAERFNLQLKYTIQFSTLLLKKRNYKIEQNI